LNLENKKGHATLYKELKTLISRLAEEERLSWVYALAIVFLLLVLHIIIDASFFSYAPLLSLMYYHSSYTTQPSTNDTIGFTALQSDRGTQSLLMKSMPMQVTMR
jgi:hypothetical protein